MAALRLGIVGVGWAGNRQADAVAELDAFAEYVAGTGGALTDGRSERRTLAVVQAGYESARTGLPVSLRQRFGAL